MRTMPVTGSWLLMLYFLLLWMLPLSVPPVKGTPLFIRHVKSRVQKSETKSGPDGFEVETKIGSRPPRCEAKCGSCVPCHPIQVPVSRPQHSSSSNSNGGRVNGLNKERVHNVALEAYWDYKPMTWKCMCGEKLFNP